MFLVLKSLTMHKTIILLLLIVNFTLAGQAIEKPTFSAVHLEKVKEDLSYDKTKRALVPRRPPQKNETEFNDKKVRKPIKAPVPGSFFGYLLGGILLSIILYYLVIALMARRKHTITVDDEDLDHIDAIEDQDLDALLQQKLAEKNYRISFRIQFLKLLQTLARKKMITWQPNKTNGTYVRECKTGSIKEKFKIITKVFDHTWYGNSQIIEEDYHLIKEYVLDLQHEIEANHE